MTTRHYIDDADMIHVVELDTSAPERSLDPWPRPARAARCGRDRTTLHPLQSGDLTWRVEYGPIEAGSETVPCRETLTKPDGAAMCPFCLAEHPDREVGIPRPGSRDVPLNKVPTSVLAGLIGQLAARVRSEGAPT